MKPLGGLGKFVGAVRPSVRSGLPRRTEWKETLFFLDPSKLGKHLGTLGTGSLGFYALLRRRCANATNDEAVRGEADKLHR